MANHIIHNALLYLSHGAVPVLQYVCSTFLPSSLESFCN